MACHCSDWCRPSPIIVSNATKNIPRIVTQGQDAVGQQAEVQQPNGGWVKMTIMGSMEKPGSGGVVMVKGSAGEQKQLQQTEEGRTFNIRLT